MIEGLFTPTHLILIVIVALIVLGPAKLGDLGGAMGRSVREFKENVDTDHDKPAAQQSPAPTVLSPGSLAPEERFDRRDGALHTEGIHAGDV